MAKETRPGPTVKIDKRINGDKTYVSVRLSIQRIDREHYLFVDPRDIGKLIRDLQEIEAVALEAQRVEIQAVTTAANPRNEPSKSRKRANDYQ